jgi:hypothetical protein
MAFVLIDKPRPHVTVITREPAAGVPTDVTNRS